MTLHLHRAARTDRLAVALGELLAVPLADPFAEEVVVVPARGVERWLTQQLAHRLGVGPRGGDGVCAGVRFLNPASLVQLLLGRDRDDPWHRDQLVWPLLATLDEVLDEPWAMPLARHLGHGRQGGDGGVGADEETAQLRRGRRYSVALRLAGHLAQYAVQRPQLVTDWREGRDTDGAGGALAPDLAWQPELWRRLLAAVPHDPPDVRHARTLERLAAGGAETEALDLPARLSLFGHTRLARTEVQLLQALGRHREVHLWLPQPSGALWRALLPEVAAGVVARESDTSAQAVAHPLLASLGRDTRELRRSLAGAVPAEHDTDLDADLDAGLDAGSPGTLLGWLQADLRADRVPDAARRAARVPRPGDRSLQVHACHGQARQVEVLREVLVGLLADDETLEPRDILVMCPDIETFAPLVSAGFGLGETAPGASSGEAGEATHPAHRLRVRLADRALSSTNPLLAVAVRLVELAGGRVTASEVLDLIGTPAVRRRFGFGDDDLDRIARWIAEAGVRWGLDAPSRARFSMSDFPQNTWRVGLDRVLLGVAMSGEDHRTLGVGLPLDDVGSNEIDLAGRLAELLHRLGATLEALGSAEAAGTWMRVLGEGVLGLVEVEGDDAWQVPQLERELARVAAAGAEREVPLRLADVRALLESRLAGRPTRANFRTGTLTVCTMTPMRSVPHRVVCLVGLDDGVFPRQVSLDGDDVLARRPLTGERDARSEDRQLLLDALLAATEHVVITYTGANEHSGAPRPPAVPLGEVLDAVDRTCATPVRDRVLVRHPLQPHDARNLVPGGVWPPEVDDRPFTFDAAALAGARAAARERVPAPPLLVDPLPPLPAADVSLADLKAFLLHPVRTFLRQRLEVATPLAPDEVGDAMPVELDGLGGWQVGQHLLTELLAGQDAQAVLLAEQLRGTLPPGQLGIGALGGVVQQCQRVLASTAALREHPARAVDVDVLLGDGRRLTGTVAGVHGAKLVTLGYSRLKPRQRLGTWVDLLALSAGHPDQSFTGHAVGRERAGPKRALSGPLDHRATGWLEELVALRDRGLREPLPLPLATACAWAEAEHRQQHGDDVDPVALARREWTTDPHNSFGIEGEDADAHHRRWLGESAPLEALLEAGLPELARAVWGPLLAGAERVGPL
ncbi:exodeoxyribonuclease V subunit gamma [Nocardioides nanhaiensis]|uniref:RecBCD enzyme subunit RecC n=1 Tax=Nocardioides nanhaiensis TaxID=1476871 RepID=A0ABP8WEL2_9ACTN